MKKSYLQINIFQGNDPYANPKYIKTYTKKIHDGDKYADIIGRLKPEGQDKHLDLFKSGQLYSVNGRVLKHTDLVPREIKEVNYLVPILENDVVLTSAILVVSYPHLSKILVKSPVNGELKEFEIGMDDDDTYRDLYNKAILAGASETTNRFLINTRAAKMCDKVDPKIKELDFIYLV